LKLQTLKGSSDLDSCFFRFVDGQLFDQAPHREEISDAKGVSCVWQRTISSVRGSVGLLVPQKLSSRVPLMAAASKEDLGACREGMVAGTSAEILYSSLHISLNDDSSNSMPSFSNSVEQ
jgi:hypothetical protein